MDEATTIVLLTSLVQTIVITLTLLVFVSQFCSQEKAIKESSYQSLMGGYNEFIMMRAEKPGLDKLLREPVHGHGTRRKITLEDTSVELHLMIA